MAKVQHTAKLSEKSVQKAATGDLRPSKRERAKSSRPRTTRCKTRHWSDGVHPLIVEYINSLSVDHRRIEVRGPEEVVIKN